MQLPEELHFIDSVMESPVTRFRVCDWLLSDFESNTWEYSFDYKKPKTLDWDVTLDNETSLIDEQNLDLLNSLKYWLIASTKAHSGSGTKSNALKGQVNIFNRTIHFMDYMLLNSEKYQLARYGLAGLTEDDLKHILDLFVSSGDSAETVYDWSNKLTQFLLDGISKTCPDEISKVLEDHPYIEDVNSVDQESYSLTLPIELLPKAKAFLYINNLYIKHRVLGKAPNSIALSKVIYAKSLKGREADKPSIPALAFTSSARDSGYARELDPVPVNSSEGERMGQGTYIIYRRSLYNMGILHEIGLPAPEISDLVAISQYQGESIPLGRFRTLPSEIVFSSVRNAIEFHLEHGKDLVNAFGKLCVFCKRNNKDSLSITPEELSSILPKKLKDFGIKSVGITTKGTEVNADTSRPIKGERSKFFDCLRSNMGFLEVFSVYYGGIQLVVGALMARRVGELLDLEAKSCLDESESYLCFENRKSTSGIMGIRNLEARPIEPIAVQMIKSLKRVQLWMIRTGYLGDYTDLFAFPSLKGTLRLSETSPHIFNRNLDHFCDYFEVQTDANDRRYYIRQHQLRRFFALLFFYSSSFGGIETLQWMLGHTDQKHVWQYITESIEGTVLRGAKAQFVTESLNKFGSDSFEDLAELIKSKFGTNDFSLVDSEELQLYLEDLMDDEKITIEPEFFEVSGNQEMRVLVKVLES